MPRILRGYHYSAAVAVAATRIMRQHINEAAPCLTTIQPLMDLNKKQQYDARTVFATIEAYRQMFLTRN